MGNCAALRLHVQTHTYYAVLYIYDGANDSVRIARSLVRIQLEWGSGALCDVVIAIVV